MHFDVRQVKYDQLLGFLWFLRVNSDTEGGGEAVYLNISISDI
jgi:hypothetical protein